MRRRSPASELSGLERAGNAVGNSVVSPVEKQPNCLSHQTCEGTHRPAPRRGAAALFGSSRIKDKYFELFRGKGGEGQEAEGGASPSGSK